MNISSTISVRTANNHVNRHNRTGGRGDRNGPGRRREWGKIGLAVLVSVLASLVVHYFTVAAIDLHPTVHALVGIVLFFVAGFILFKIVLF